MIKIDKFQRHPTDASCVRLHLSGPALPEGMTRDIVNQGYRDALEAAGKMVD